jgi:hypothetical protein
MPARRSRLPKRSMTTQLGHQDVASPAEAFPMFHVKQRADHEHGFDTAAARRRGGEEPTLATCQAAAGANPNPGSGSPPAPERGRIQARPRAGSQPRTREASPQAPERGSESGMDQGPGPRLEPATSSPDANRTRIRWRFAAHRRPVSRETSAVARGWIAIRFAFARLTIERQRRPLAIWHASVYSACSLTRFARVRCCRFTEERPP